MQLYIAEKPSVAKAIAAGIGGMKRGEGFYTCSGDKVVTWCVGHLLEQADPAHYDPIYKKWSESALPIIPDQWKLVVKKQTAAQFKIVKDLVKKADVIVHAGDPDREGQLLVDELLEHVGNKAPVKRLLLAAVDERSVARALSALKDNKDFQPLKDSALARQRADWLFGINITRAMTLAAQKHGVDGVISAGRVQSPTVTLVVDRDREIERFVPKDYFVPSIDVAHANGNFTAVWESREDYPGVDEEGRLTSEKHAQALVQKAKGEKGTLVQASYTEKQAPPPLPHNLSTLQKAASAKLGLTAAKTLEVAQSLYDAGITSYPRSDCQYLPEEQFQDAPQVLSALAGKGFPAAKGATPSIRTKAWDTKKAPVHHAIIPTGSFKKSMNDLEQKVFAIIAEAYICQFYPNMRYVAQQVIVGLADEKWKATGRQVLDPGWKKVSGKSDDDDGQKEGPLPQNMRQNDPVAATDAKVAAKKTQPPKRFTDGTLIEAIGNIHRFVKDPNIKKILKETSGIGTEATRGNIIETVFSRKYFKREGKNIISTPLGREVRDRLPQGLCDPGTTAAWEDILKQVEEGKVRRDDFLANIVKRIPKMVEAALGAKFDTKLGGKVEKCPTCGGPLKRFRSKKNKSYYFWACTDRTHPLLSDNNGKPGEPFGEKKPDTSPKAPCPEDGCKEMMNRRTSSKNSDFHFWACANQDHPLRKDEDGAPGEILDFSRKAPSSSGARMGGGKRAPRRR